MMRQYIAVVFRPGGPPYTYHYDGPETFAAGAEVKVEDDSRGHARVTSGWKRVTVVGPAAVPDFPTKSILGGAPA